MEVAEQIVKSGHKTYIVGGYIRDILLGLEPRDIDLFTEATTDELLAIFPNANTKWIRWKVLIINGIDVACYRDGATTLYEDASRRDFSINALYYEVTADTTHESISLDCIQTHLFWSASTSPGCDPTGQGISDISNKLIRLVGSFEPDLNRIARCIRLAANLGLTIEESTYASMIETIGRINWDAPRRPKPNTTYTPLMNVNYKKLWREIRKIVSFKSAIEIIAADYNIDVHMFDDSDHLCINVYKFILKLCNNNEDNCWEIINRFGMSRRHKKLIRIRFAC